MDDKATCYFCKSEFEMDEYEWYTEEVGEFWSEALQDSVIAHPHCLPNGIDAVVTGADPDWKMA